jgi:hypothetical protein
MSYYTWIAPAYAVLWFGLMLLCMTLGYGIGRRRFAEDPEGAKAGIGAIEGGILGLLGLLIAFTFSGAQSRLEMRRQEAVEEANDIRTAYLRLDLLPAERQPELRDLFRKYLEKRISACQALPNVKLALHELEEASKLQEVIWLRAVDACRMENPLDAGDLLLPAINAMIDITSQRTMAAKTHTPVLILIALFVVGMSSAVISGYAIAASTRRKLLHLLAFATATAITIYVILNLEYPRIGLIRLDWTDQALVELLDKMK